jgi:hypothetical protein
MDTYTEPGQTKKQSCFILKKLFYIKSLTVKARLVTLFF